MNSCDTCYNEWRERYNLAVQRFDRAIATATIVTIIAATMGLVATVLCVLCVIRTHNFISSFEYVEETIISQDGEGQNIAILGDNATANVVKED